MKLTYRRAAVASFALTAALFVALCMISCGSYYAAAATDGVCAGKTQFHVWASTRNPNCDALAADERATMRVAADLNLDGTHRGAELVYREDSDGGAFPPDNGQRSDGYTSIYGQTFCEDPPLVELASFDFAEHHAAQVVCHEGIHIARGCYPMDHATVEASLPDGGVQRFCVGFFCENHVDERCSEAVDEELNGL